ncbi:MAG: hypothetical protein WA151_11090 [Desulfatirhabdiaceae bacterium]
MELISTTHPDFWKYFDKLPKEIQISAEKRFELFRSQPFHPSLSFSKKGSVWTVDIGLHYRAIAFREQDTLVWFWIGSHEDYNHMMNRYQ